MTDACSVVAYTWGVRELPESISHIRKDWCDKCLLGADVWAGANREV